MAEKFRQLRKGGDAMPKTTISPTTTKIGSHMPRLALRDCQTAFGGVGRDGLVCDMLWESLKRRWAAYAE